MTLSDCANQKQELQGKIDESGKKIGDKRKQMQSLREELRVLGQSVSEGFAVEPPIKDTPNIGHSSKYLSTEDIVPKVHFPIFKVENLYLGKLANNDHSKQNNFGSHYFF